VGAFAGGAGLGAYPESVVVSEEHLRVIAVGDGVLSGDGVGGDVDDGEISGEEAVGLELLAGDVEGDSVRHGCGDSAGDHDLAGEGGDVGHRGGDVVELESAGLE